MVRVGVNRCQKQHITDTVNNKMKNIKQTIYKYFCNDCKKYISPIEWGDDSEPDLECECCHGKNINTETHVNTFSNNTEILKRLTIIKEMFKEFHKYGTGLKNIETHLNALIGEMKDE